ncbi:MAG TPA: GGDEF domain-containing protein [Hyphomicrobiaceae bacterium]|nr:GGDEF domain-containing protein [Hyphomicrobiaceae bacterium]
MDAILAFLPDGGTRNHALAQAAENLAALLAVMKLPPRLMSSRDHSVLLSMRRMHFLTARLGVTAIFLCIATIAWIPIDGVLFGWDWNILLPLIVGRMATGLMFFAIASLQLRSASLHQGVGALGSTICIGTGFFIYSHMVLAGGGSAVLEGPGHAQYLLMPVALAVGISIFPLTLKEVSLILFVPFAALMFEMLRSDGGEAWSHTGTAVSLMCAVVITTAVCSLSQLKLLIALEEQSTIDPLTGTLSRRAGIELLDLLFARSDRAKSPLSLALLDLDHFKKVNDGYGHDAGDQLLREVVQGLKGRLRREDALIRWGGEEFLLVFSGMPAESAAELIVKLSRSGLALRPDGSMQTASAGLAEQQDDQVQSWHELIEIADSRMYEAKKLGRNRLIARGGKSYHFGG